MTTAAEKGVKAAEQALAQAEAQLVALDEEITRQETTATEVEALIAGKHEAGEAVSPSDRKRRREAEAERSDLQGERNTLLQLVERRRAEIQVAHVDLAVERAAEYRNEGAALGGELWQVLATLAELWDRMEAVVAAHRRESNTASRAGRAGTASPLQAAGLEIRKAAIADLVTAVRPDLAKRGAAA